jgi:hypothetical protein
MYWALTEVPLSHFVEFLDLCPQHHPPRPATNCPLPQREVYKRIRKQRSPIFESGSQTGLLYVFETQQIHVKGN